MEKGLKFGDGFGRPKVFRGGKGGGERAVFGPSGFGGDFWKSVAENGFGVLGVGEEDFED